MRYLYLLLLNILLFSCQPSQPSEVDIYEANQAKAHQTLETEFNQLIRQQIQTLNEESLATKNFLVSQQAQKELEKTLASLTMDNKTNSEDQTNSNPSDSTNVKTTLPNTPDKISNGALLLNVRDYEDTYNKVHTLADKHQFNIASEVEQTTNFYKGNTVEIHTNPDNFDLLIQEFRDLALIIRTKQVWQQKENNDFLKIQNQLISTKKQLEDLNVQLAATNNLDGQLQIKDKIAKVSSRLDLAVLTANNTLKNEAYSSITLAFYQNIEMEKPAPKTFSAGFSANVVTGWTNFKQFVLEAALIWPYIILALIFLSTIFLAISSSRRKARQFKLQLLHGQNMQLQQAAQKKSK